MHEKGLPNDTSGPIRGVPANDDTGPTVSLPSGGVMFKSTLCSLLSRSSRHSSSDASKDSNARLTRVQTVVLALAFKDSAPVPPAVLRRNSFIIAAFFDKAKSRAWWELGTIVRVLKKDGKMSDPSAKLDLRDADTDRSAFEVLCYWFKPTSDSTVFEQLTDVDHTYYCASCVLMVLQDPSDVLPLPERVDSTIMQVWVISHSMALITEKFALFEADQMRAGVNVGRVSVAPNANQQNRAAAADADTGASAQRNGNLLISDMPSDRPKRTRALPGRLAGPEISIEHRR